MTDFSALGSACSGPVLTPDDTGFHDEVSSWRLNVAHHPDAVVGARTPQDVVEAVKFALANKLVVSVQATGHGTTAPVTSGLLVNTKGLDELSIDAGAKTATIGAGVQWGAVVAAAAEHDLAVVPGSSTTVGVIGYLAGGGLGPIARSHGYSSDYVTSFTVVTGAGELVDASAGTNPDLFWALRGGKYGLGIVTSITLRLVELPELYAGSIAFDAPDIEAGLRAWADFTRAAPADVTTSVAIVRAPDAEFVPQPIRGRTLLMVRFAVPADAATGERLAAPLRAAAPVYLDQLGPMKAGDMALIHNDPTAPSNAWSTGGQLDAFPDELVTAVLGALGPGRDVPIVAAEFRHVGAATAADVPEGSAVGGRSSEYAFNLVGAPNPALFATVLPAVADGMLKMLSPWESAVENVNFAGRWDAAHAAAATWPDEMATKLDAIRSENDPSHVFSNAHE